MEGALFHTMTVIFFNLFWLYDRKWEGLKEIYGFGKEPYNDIQKSLIKLVWFYTFSGVITLIFVLYKTL